MKENKSYIKKMLYLGPPEFKGLVKSNFKDYQVLTIEKVDDLDKILKNIQIIIDASLEIKFDKKRLSHANQLKIFATASTGYTHVDLKELNDRDIKLISLKGKRDFLRKITPAAEHSWLLLMMCARKVRAAILDLDNDIWERTRYPGLILRGKTIGIIGVGRIGSWMAKYAESFGMNCLGYDPYPENIPSNVRLKSLEELVQESDFITLHVNYEKSLEKFISSSLIKKFKPGCVFINTSRGELVDEEALLNSFLNGSILSLGLDVLTNEREYRDSELYKLSKKNKNIIITPHIGGYSPEVLQIVLNFICKEVNSLL